MGFVPLWVALFLGWTSYVFWLGWKARATMEVEKFLASFHRKPKDPPSGGVRV